MAIIHDVAHDANWCATEQVKEFWEDFNADYEFLTDSIAGQPRGIAPCILKEGQRVKSSIQPKKAKGKEKLVLPLGKASPLDRLINLYLNHWKRAKPNSIRGRSNTVKPVFTKIG